MTAADRIDLAALWAWALGRPPTTAETLEVLVPLAHAVLAAAEDGLVCGSRKDATFAYCADEMQYHGVVYDHDFVPAVVLAVKDPS